MIIEYPVFRRKGVKAKFNLDQYAGYSVAEWDTCRIHLTNGNTVHTAWSPEHLERAIAKAEKISDDAEAAWESGEYE